MRFAVIAYGDKKAWLPMFCKFYASFIASNPGSVITVVTGGERPWSQRDVFGVPVLQINTSDSAITKSNLNMSGILMAHAAMRLSSVLVMTLDCDVKKQIQEGYWSRSDMAVGDDPATRIWMMGDREIEEKTWQFNGADQGPLGKDFLHYGIKGLKTGVHLCAHFGSKWFGVKYFGPLETGLFIQKSLTGLTGGGRTIKMPSWFTGMESQNGWKTLNFQAGGRITS